MGAAAVGRAYLAYCPENEREKILALMRRSDKAENRLARDTRVSNGYSLTRAAKDMARATRLSWGWYGRQAMTGSRNCGYLSWTVAGSMA